MLCVLWQCIWYLVRWRLWIQNLVISEIMTAEGRRRCWGLLLGTSASICLQMEEFNNSECSLILIVQWIFYILQWMLYWKYLTLNEFLGNSFISLFESLKHWNIHCLNTKIRRRHTYGIWTLDCSGFTRLNVRGGPGSRETWRDSAPSCIIIHHAPLPPATTLIILCWFSCGQTSLCSAFKPTQTC